jgi:hypothetical protein
MAAMSGAPIQVMPAPQGIFPHAAQVFLIERYVHDLDGALHTAGRTKITTSLRWISRNPTRALNILDQPT